MVGEFGEDEIWQLYESGIEKHGQFGNLFKALCEDDCSEAQFAETADRKEL